MALKIAWTKVEVGTTNGSSRGANADKVVLSASTKTGDRPNKVTIGADLIRQLGWKQGDRVTLYKSGTSLFKFAKEPAGLCTLTYSSCKKVKSDYHCLYIVSKSLCLEFGYPINGLVYEAWLDDGDLLMRPYRK